MLKKTLLTLVLMAAVGMLAAQTLQFEWQGQVYSEGDKVVVTELDPDFGNEFVLHMQLHNLTEEDINVIVAKEEIQMVEGSTNSICWGACYSPSVFVTPPRVLQAHAISNDFELAFHHNIDPDATYDPAQYLTGTSIVKYTAYDELNPEEKATLVVWFAYNADGVAEYAPNVMHAYPNPATTEVNFNFEAPAGKNVMMTAVVYNLLGQEVMRQDVNTMQGRITFDVSRLQAGVYFCNFMANGSAVKTEKFVVKK